MFDGASSSATLPALWAGVECTVNRVGDQYFDQLARGGHAAREGDLDQLASLGVTAVRYPVLWERTAPDGLASADWSWSDRRLSRLRELGIRPIVGLLHHGSGPRDTDLLDPAFPEKLAAYAGAVAVRYPWVVDWTPVNEPCTTARFAALYGHWYPHRRDIRSFARALVNQCRGTALAMRAVRAVNPSARLVLTEEFGRIASTATLAYQASYENARRLLAVDLLVGVVDPGHRLWDHLIACGIRAGELEAFARDPVPPDVIGVNYYLTSDRFLDHRLERYPTNTHGGNGRHRYADVEAVRVAKAGVTGHAAIFDELWTRYGRPLAVTETHVGCTREEQLRWLLEAWTAAASARRQGVDLRAVTVWSAFGALDWDSLVVRAAGHYEPGIFDARATPPRPTALATCARSLAREGTFSHPVLASPGWWRRRDRVLFPAEARPVAREVRARTLAGTLAAPLLITGASGTLGRAFSRLAAGRGLSHVLLSRRDMDIADRASVRNAVERHGPWAVINAAGYVRVDDAETDRERCRGANVTGAANLAAVCGDRGIPLVTFSSDLVFDGTSGPYIESDAPAPLGCYGRCKAEAERAVLETHPSALVVRTAAFFGAWDQHNFVVAVLRALEQGQPFTAADDLVISPTYVSDLVHATLDLLLDGEQGLRHLANEGAVSWAELASLVARMAGLDPALIEGRPAARLGFVAPRPPASVLATERGSLMRPLPEALGAFFAERAALASPDIVRTEEAACASWLPGEPATSEAS